MYSRVDEADGDLACHVSQAVHELLYLVHLPHLPHGIPAEVGRLCGDVGDVACVETSIGSAVPEMTIEDIILTLPRDNKLILVVVVA